MAKTPKGKLTKLETQTFKVRMGPAGKTGSQGGTGPTGAPGLDGRSGDRGLSGSDGAQGPQGLQGPTGDTGSAGRDGTNGSEGIQGVPGPQGDVGLPPNHRWSGNKLQFKLPDGTWGKSTDLTGPGGGERHAHGGNEQRVSVLSLAGNVLTLEQLSGGISIPDVTVDLSSLSVSAFPEFQFNADNTQSPTNADWVVTALAPLSADPSNASLSVRLFDDVDGEATGFELEVPSGATSIVLSFKSRAVTAPPAVRTVGLNLYNRGIPDNAAVQAWSAATQLTDIDLPTNAFFQYDTQTITLASLGITAGEQTKFELQRTTPSGGTDLVGDWALLQIKVGFL